MNTTIIGLSALDQDQADDLAQRLWVLYGFDVLSVKRDIAETAAAAFGITHHWLLGEAETDPQMVMDPWGATGPELFRRVERLFGEAHWCTRIAQWWEHEMLHGHEIVTPDVTTPQRARALRRAGGRLVHLGEPFLLVQPGDVVLGEGDPMDLADAIASLLLAEV